MSTLLWKRTRLGQIEMVSKLYVDARELAARPVTQALTESKKTLTPVRRERYFPNALESLLQRIPAALLPRQLLFLKLLLLEEPAQGGVA